MGTKRRALVFGATGQDGSFLCEQLVKRGYEVFAVVRRSSGGRIGSLEGFTNKSFHIVSGDVTDISSVTLLLKEHEPDEIYNLAAQSHVGTSFNQPALTTEVTYGGCLNILEAARLHAPWVRVYQASSSEMFGANIDEDGKQRETTPMLPCSPYGVAKLAAHNLVRIYRESYGLYACCGILFNHESERRGAQFVTRKISKYVGWLKQFGLGSGSQPADEKFMLHLGNLDAQRDWGYAPEYTDAMWRMLQQDEPEDYVIATGETFTVYDFLVSAFGAIGLNEEDMRKFVVTDPTLHRPCEVPVLCGDATKARQKLGWRPFTSMNELARIMVEHDGKAATKTSERSQEGSYPELEK